MARDFPEYEKKEIVQPQTQPSGIEVAKPQSMSASYAAMGGAYEALAQFGSQLAQNSAQEEAQVVGYRGSQALKKMYEESAKDPNPTGETLNRYQKNAQGIIEKLIENSNPSNRAHLKRSLEQVYEGHFYNLTNKVENSNRQFIKKERAAQFDSDSENMRSANMEGRYEVASKFRESLFNGIDIDPDHTPQEKENAKKEIMEIYNASVGQGEYLKQDEDKKDEFISGIRKDPDNHDFLKGLNKVQQDRVIDSVKQFGNSYQSALQGQRSIDFIKYSNAIENKSFTPEMMEEARQSLSGLQLAQLGKIQNKISLKEAVNTENHRFVSSVAGHADQINEIDQKKINAAAKVELSNYSNAKKIQTGDGKLSLSEQTQALTNWKAPVTFIQKALNETAKGGSIQNKIDAANAIDYAQMKNPNLISGLGKNALDFTDSFFSRKAAGETEENAIIGAHKEVYEVDEKELKRRDLQWDNITSDKSSKYNFKDIDKRDSFVAKQISGAGWFSSKANLSITPDFVEEYMEQLRRNFTGDMDRAVERTTKAFDRTNGETIIDGERNKKFTHAPIEKYLPPDRKMEAMKFVKQQMLDKTKELCAGYKELYERKEKGEAGGLDYYFEIIPTRSVATLGEIKVKQVWRSGEVIKGYWSFDADKFTTANDITRMPSYAVKFKTKKTPVGQDILNPKTMTLGDYVRYKTDLTEFYAPIIREEQQTTEGLKKEAKRRQEQNRAINERLKEYHDNIEKYQDEYGDDLWN